MSSLWQRLVEWCRGVFSRPAVPLPVGLLAAPLQRAPIATPEVICLPYQPQRRKRSEIRADVLYAKGVSGQFYFRDTILDQLGDYMVYLKRMKTGAPDAYRLYSKVGASVMPQYWGKYTYIKEQELSPWFRQTLPSFGAAASGVSPRTEKEEEAGDTLYPRFLWFQKYERPPREVEWATSGATYICCIYADKKNSEKWKTGRPIEFPVEVLPDGTVRVLRTVVQREQVIHHRHGRHRGYSSTVPHQRWGIHPFFLKWAKENDISPQQLLAGYFVAAANNVETIQHSMIRVEARKDGIAAVFGVDVERTPYFFADREEAVTTDGGKQRIFHAVRTHVRKNGSAVRMHFRGLRRFRWNGYDIHITVPGFDHWDMSDLNVGSIDSEFRGEYDRLVEEEELGTLIASTVEAAGDWKKQRQIWSAH